MKEGEIAKKTQMYQTFLEKVLESAHEFTEINDVIVRFAALEATNRDLNLHSKEVAEGTDRARCGGGGPGRLQARCTGACARKWGPSFTSAQLSRWQMLRPLLHRTASC